MRKPIIKMLLRALNSRWLNRTPCEYGFIGNVDAFAYSHLKSEESQRPGISVAEVLREADNFRACPIRAGLTVMESDGSTRDADAWDLHELRQSLSPKSAEDQ